MKGWTIAGVIVLLIIIGGIMRCTGCYQDPDYSKTNTNNTSTKTTTTKTPEMPKAKSSKNSSWSEGTYQGISYKIPPGFREKAKRTDENGQPFIQIANDNGRVYQFEIVYNAISNFGSYEAAAATMITLIKSTYFNDIDVNFVAEQIYSKYIGNTSYSVIPSDKPLLNAYISKHGNDVYCIIAISDNMVEAESFVESIEIQ